MTHKQIKFVSLCLVVFAKGAIAQNVTGTGTANTVPLFTGSSTLGNSNITESSGKVGIATTAPAYQLDVAGGNARVYGSSYANTGNYAGLYLGDGAAGIAAAWGAGLRFDVYDPGGNGTLGANSMDALSISQINGYVGIGTTTPANPLNIYVPASSSQIGAMSIDVSGFGTIANASNSYFFRVRDIGANSTYFYINGIGNAGFGTASPGARVEVNGNLKLTAGSGASITFPDATVQSTAWNGTLAGGDYAESIDVLGDRTTYEPGDVIVIDDSETGKFHKSDKAYSKLVAGVFSTKPGLVGRRTTADRPDKEAEVPMAMMGIVPTKVSAENGPIERGDLLVSSSRSGYAMKGTDSDRLIGAVIGKALAPLKSGSGVIEVLVSLQ